MNKLFKNSLIIGGILSSGLLVGCGLNNNESAKVLPGPNHQRPVSGPLAPQPPRLEFTNVKILMADAPSYYNQETEVIVKVSPSSYFNYGYSTFNGPYDQTHYSFQLNGKGWQPIYAYGPRTQFRDLFKYIVENGGEDVPVKMVITTNAAHEDSQIWSVVSWEPLN